MKQIPTSWGNLNTPEHMGSIMGRDIDRLGCREWVCQILIQSNNPAAVCQTLIQSNNPDAYSRGNDFE